MPKKEVFLVEPWNLVGAVHRLKGAGKHKVMRAAIENEQVTVEVLPGKKILLTYKGATSKTSVANIDSAMAFLVMRVLDPCKSNEPPRRKSLDGYGNE